MRKIVVIITLLSMVLSMQAQEYGFALFFSDKEGTPYTIEEPQEFLSVKALQRRVKYQIEIDETDLPVSPVYINQVKELGFEVEHASKWLNVLLVKTTDSSLVEQLHSLSFIDSIACVFMPYSGKHNLVHKEEGETLCPASSNVRKGTTEEGYGEAYNQIEMIGGLPLHEENIKGQGVTIGVLDAGFSKADITPAFDHMAATELGTLLGTTSFVNDGVGVFSPSVSSHGTNVLSTMAAYEENVMIGTAPLANYYLIRTEDASSEYPIEEYYWVCGAEWADSVGVDVINSSLGYTTFDNAVLDYPTSAMDGKTRAVTIGASMAVDKGIFVVNSAGNEGDDPWRIISAPADSPNVFTIGAVDGDGVYAGFSSVGPNAAGELKPNVVAKGKGTTVIRPGESNTFNGSGTSFSSPIIAGMSACLLQMDLETPPHLLALAIEQSASQYDYPDTLLGYGVPNYEYASTFLTIEEPITTSSIVCFPNPAKESITISGELFHPEMVEVNTLDGKRVLAKQVRQMPIELSLSGLSEGLYFVIVHSAQGVVVEKIVIE